MKSLCLSIVTILALATSAHASTLGCYVSFSNPTVCSSSQIFCGASYTENYLAFGYPVAEICQDYLDAYSTLLNCDAFYDDMVIQRDLALGDVTALRGALAEANAIIVKTSTDLGKSLALSKKLKKACGSKCKRIK